MRLGQVFATAVLAAAPLVLAACDVGSAGEASPSGPGVARQQDRLPTPTTSTVTTSQLGSDSVIAVVGSERDLTRSLEVITPDGVRHGVYSVAYDSSPSGATARGDFTLADWRPELQTALLMVSRGRAGATAVAYDVVAGATRSVDLPRRVISIALHPDGSGVLMTTHAERGEPSIWTLGWDGAEEPLPGSSIGSAITSPDGRTLVAGAAHSRRWWVIDLATRTSRAVEPPGSCTRLRWLDDDTLLTTCYRRGSNQLGSTGLDGTTVPLGLTYRAAGNRIFLDGDVREVQGRPWHWSHSACVSLVTDQRPASGTLRRVRVPGARASVSLVGVRGDDLVIIRDWPELIAAECNLPRTRSELALFDPVAGTKTVLTRLRWAESWTTTLAATEVRPWNP